MADLFTNASANFLDISGNVFAIMKNNPKLQSYVHLPGNAYGEIHILRHIIPADFLPQQRCKEFYPHPCHLLQSRVIEQIDTENAGDKLQQRHQCHKNAIRYRIVDDLDAILLNRCVVPMDIVNKQY